MPVASVTYHHKKKNYSIDRRSPPLSVCIHISDRKVTVRSRSKALFCLSGSKVLRHELTQWLSGRVSEPENISAWTSNAQCEKTKVRTVAPKRKHWKKHWP